MDQKQYIGLEKNYLIGERLKKTHPLQQLFWECTLRCNLACRHCGSDCLKDIQSSEMPIEHFLPVLDEIAQHQPPRSIMVSTVGGEPLVRKDLIECGRQITSRGFHWGLVTNGHLLDREMLARLTNAGLDSISVDIDGVKDDHNWLRNSTDSFDRAMRAVDAIVHSDANLAWDIITCVTPHNIDRLPETRQMLIDAGVKKWRCFTIVPMGRAKGQDDLQLTDHQFRDLLNFIVTTRLDGQIHLSYSCEGYLGVYEGVVRDHYFGCDAGLTVASVRANGDISGCLSIRSDYNQGNIYHDSFWDVWQNRFQLYRDREWMKKGPCADCEAFRYCQGNGFHLRDENGDLMLCHYNRLKNVIVK